MRVAFDQDRDTLVISEVFGPTVQGEGPHLGEQATFIRLGGCNLHCTWCDTAYTWDASRYDLRAELNRQPITDIVNQVTKIGASRVIITGGEPLLHQHQPGWQRLLATLYGLGYKIEIETNGTIKPTEQTIGDTDQFNVSPKLDQGDPEHLRIIPDVLRTFRDLDQAVFKIVCCDTPDVTQARKLADDHDLPLHRMYVMPQGITADEMIATTSKIATTVIDQGMNLTTRLHLLAWGTERGH